MVERKPGELLKLTSRLDSLGSDVYRSKVADKCPELLEGPGVMKASYCIALKEDDKLFQAPVLKKSTVPIISENKRSGRQNGGSTCLIQK